MPSRRNELSAYTFSRRRTVAAFLQPSGGGNEEDAPKALRAVMPSLVVGALTVAGFGAYGMIKPSAPLHWDTANAVIVDKQTTTRYVMLGDHKLHPVLNIASARLLLGANSSVEEVDDSVLNSGTVPHGATIGIPYAPDSLPTAKDAANAKVWAECDRPASGGQGGTDQKLFVLGGADAAKVAGARRVDGHHAFYVQGPDGAAYLVDATGTAHLLASGTDKSANTQLSSVTAAGASSSPSPGSGSSSGKNKKGKQGAGTPATSPSTTPSQPAASPSSAAGSPSSMLLATAAFGATVGQPQAVTKEWLATLRIGDPITVPKADIAGYGQPTPVRISGVNHVGDLFRVLGDNGQYLHYVVLQDGIHRVSDFTDRLLGALHTDMVDEPRVDAVAVPGANTAAQFEGAKDWPQSTVSQVNSVTNGGGSTSGSTVACSVYTGSTSASGAPVLGLWAGPAYPIDSSSGSAGVYVTPGTGLLYRSVSGTSTTAGAVDLLTDTGLRYPVQINTDSSASGAGAGASGASSAPAAPPSTTGQGGAQPDNAQARLGYGGLKPAPVPESWSSLLPSGPNLNSTAAAEQQGS